MIELGKSYSLTVVSKTGFGAYLDAENLGEVLLPRKFVPPQLAVGERIEVFLYLDSEDRPVATTQRPKVAVGEFAYLRAVDSTEVGTFLDWGLDKDLLVPFSEQHRPMEVGHSYLVYLYLDKHDGRIVASSKIDKFLDDERPHHFKLRQAVDLIIANSTDLGYKAIINHSHWGVLYKSDLYERLSFGQSKMGFIKQVRPDGKIDLSLQGGQETRDKNAQIIENYLRQKNGFAPLHDKSDPQLISDLLGMSKAAFKKAIGNLYKQRVITIEKEGIRLVER
jgi:predicted RNA-binding protein (virulence factor B family)